MEEPLHILPGSAELDSALALPGTKVIMKSGKAIHETAAALERHGLLANAGMVADCGLETEQVYTDLRQLPEEIFTRAYIAKLYQMEHGKYDPCFDSLEFVP